MTLEFGIFLFKRILKLSYTICNYLINRFIKPIEPSREMKNPPDIDSDFLNDINK